MSIHSKGPPFAPVPNMFGVTDSSAKKLVVHKDVAEILCTLHHAHIPILLCSRSPAPQWCRDAISSISISPKHCSDIKFGDVIHRASIIRPAQSKVKHLQEIQASLNIPFERMLFFDDEKRICNEARQLGVRCVNVDPKQGVTKGRFAEGPELFLPGREPPKPAGKALAFLVFLRSRDSRVESIEMFIQRRGTQLCEGGTYCFPGGFLNREEEEWNQKETASEESRCAARWRAALRETALDCGGATGPGLRSVYLPKVCETDGQGTLKTEVQTGVRLPGSFGHLELGAIAKSEIQLQLGGYTHCFFFHPLGMEATKGWNPATARKRASASEPHWVPLTSLLTDPAQTIADKNASLCSWVQELLRNYRDPIEELVNGIPKAKLSHQKLSHAHQSDISCEDGNFSKGTASLQAELSLVPDAPPKSPKAVSPPDSPTVAQCAASQRMSSVRRAPSLRAMSKSAVKVSKTASSGSLASKFKSLKQLRSSHLPPIGGTSPTSQASQSVDEYHPEVNSNE